MKRAGVSVLIPTRDAGCRFRNLLDALRTQSRPIDELRVIDSGSRDGTAELASQYGAVVTRINPLDFDHGATRNQLARLATYETLVFLTQDAVPAHATWLERLIAPLASGEANAAFARQLPRPGAGPLEAFSRQHNYPKESRRVTQEDVSRFGIWAYFFSNASSAVQRDTFDRLGGFPTGHVMNEDLLFAARLLASGGAIAYAADACVEHSHPYGVADTFRRYFDIGTVMYAARDELALARRLPAGTSYAWALFRHLASERAYGALALAIAETGAKGVGYALGQRSSRLPRAWRRRMSLHPGYWEERRRP